MGQIARYLWRMVPAAALGLTVYALTRPARLRRLAARGLETTPAHEGLLALLVMFTAGLLWLTVLPEVLWQGGRLLLREEGLGGVNLRPLLIFRQARALSRRGVRGYFLINFWGNIAMFLPVGALPALLWRRGRWWKAALTGAGLSVCIELSQLLIRRGTDIDDLWLNTLGALAGYWLALAVGRLWPEWTENCKVGEIKGWT